MMYNKKFYEWFEEKFNEADTFTGKNFSEEDRVHFISRKSEIDKRLFEINGIMAKLESFNVDDLTQILSHFKDEWDHKSKYIMGLMPQPGDYE